MSIGLFGGIFFVLAVLICVYAFRLEAQSEQAIYKGIDVALDLQDDRRWAWICFFCAGSLGFISEAIRLSNNCS
jgi:hypothetical protein